MTRTPDRELSERLLQLLGVDRRGKSLRKLCELAGLPGFEKKRVRRLLRELQGDGRVVKLERDRYGLPPRKETVEGILLRKGRHYRLRVEGPKGELDYRVHREDRVGALPGDRVLARLRAPGDGQWGEARVESVLARGGLPVVGIFERRAKACFVRPDREEELGPIFVPNPGREAEDGDLVAVALDDSLPDGKLRGRILRVLGEPGSLEGELGRLKVDHGLPEEFPARVLAGLADGPKDAFAESRLDLRTQPLVTIDPPDARDFDDAVWVDELESGYRLWVAIADVAAYVPVGGVLDAEAASRACSTYLPGQVVPMLPPVLSEEHCSLQPGRDRAAMVLEMDFDGAGELRSLRAARALIRSQARLSYGQVQAVFDGESDTTRCGQALRLAEPLQAMARLARLLLDKLARRGQLDFDLPESDIRLDEDGRPEQVRPASRFFANRLVEAFMIAANEAVAENLGMAGAPLAWRVHPEPDPEKMRIFAAAAEELAHPAPFGEQPSPLEVQRFLACLAGHEAEKVLSSLLLRSLMQARYDTENIGHYGLASATYLHFTSPIRRYPDLMVHRQLGAWLQGAHGLTPLGAHRPAPADWPHSAETTAVLCESSSEGERRAVGAERAAVDLYHAAFMRERIGETYPARVVFVAEFGLFVRAEPSGIEGLVPARSLMDDRYQFDPERMSLTGRRSGRSFRMAQELMVRVADANLAAGQVEYELL